MFQNHIWFNIFIWFFMTILSRLQSVWQSLELREKLLRGKADVRMREHAKVVILRRPADALDFRRRPRKSELHEN